MPRVWPARWRGSELCAKLQTMKTLPETILFDLDNTLLGMKEEEFVQLYLGSLAEKFKDQLDPKRLVAAIWEGVGAIYANDGSKINEDVFWDAAEKSYGSSLRHMKEDFDEYYRTDFVLAKDACYEKPEAKILIDSLKQDRRLILATNPIFPAEAVRQRLKWAGLDADDFVYITTYENSTSCKPNPAYYQEILEKTNTQLCECIMIGNDAEEDMNAALTGMDTLLIMDGLINRKNRDLDAYEKMTLKELAQAV